MSRATSRSVNPAVPQSEEPVDHGPVPVEQVDEHGLAARAGLLRVSLFDYDAYERDLQPLLHASLSSGNDEALGAWLVMHVGRLQHPDRQTFPSPATTDDAVDEHSLSGYAALGLSAFFEPEATASLPAGRELWYVLQQTAQEPESLAAAVTGVPIAAPALDPLRLPSGEAVGLLSPAQVVKLSSILSRARQELRWPQVELPTDGRRGELRRGLDQLIDLYEEASDVQVGLLFRFAID